MAGNFIPMVYAVLKDKGVDTKDMTADEAVEKYNEIIGKTGRYDVETGEQKKDGGKEEMAKKKFTTFEEQVDGVLSGEYKGSHITLSNETPKVLQKIGVPNKPMLMTYKHCYTAINKSGKYNGKGDHYHSLGKDLFLNLPKLLESPAIVFQSRDEYGNLIPDDIVAIVNALDRNKKPVILPIKINGQGKQNFIRIDANIVKSAYGRENFENYIKNNVGEFNILLIENKKIRNLNS